MKNASRLPGRASGALALIALCSSFAVCAADPTPGPPADAPKPAATHAAGPGHASAGAHGDIAGTWEQQFALGNFFSMTPVKSTDKQFTLGDGSVIPLRPAAEKLYRDRVAMSETSHPFATTTVSCLPLGTPGNMMGAPPYLVRIMQSPKFVAILLEEGWEFRAIYIDGKHPDELLPSFMGHSIGHWEGKTLVVETVGLREETTLNFMGLPHSDQLKVVEHLTRTAPDTLVDMIEINDPVDYYKPFTFKSVFKKTDRDQIEYICEDSHVKVTPDGRQTYHTP